MKKINLKQLDILKEKTRTTKDLQSCMIYFYDHFADHPAFLDMSKPTFNAELEKILYAIGQKTLNKIHITIQEKLFLSVDGYDNFIHGPVIIENKMMSIFYFTDIRLGAFALHTGNETLFGRITAMRADNLQMPSDPQLN